MSEKKTNGIKNFFEEFKAFAMRGNVLDMAVGVVVGSMVINSLALHIFYGYAWAVLIARIPNALVLTAVNTVLLRILLENRALMAVAKR